MRVAAARWCERLLFPPLFLSTGCSPCPQGALPATAREGEEGEALAVMPSRRRHLLLRGPGLREAAPVSSLASGLPATPLRLKFWSSGVRVLQP